MLFWWEAGLFALAKAAREHKVVAIEGSLLAGWQLWFGSFRRPGEEGISLAALWKGRAETLIRLWRGRD